MHSLVIFEQDVEEVLGVILPDILHAKVVDHKGKHNGAGGVCPETRGVFGRSVSMGGEDGCLFCVGEDAGLGGPYIPFRISKNTQPSGVTYCCKLYSCMNSSGICDVWTRIFS